MFLILSIVVSWYAKKRGYYNLPFKDHKHPAINFFHVITSFLIFIAVYIFFAPICLRFLASLFINHMNQIHLISFLQLFVFALTGILLWIYAYYQEHSMMKRIWKDWSFPGASTIPFDLGIGALTWLVAFPIVIFASEIAEAFNLIVFGEFGKEQIAIQYLKLALSSPFSLIVALLTIIVGAPFLEEYLFRGILQTWLRTKLSPLGGIGISSLAFALFHLAPSQGYGNIPLFFSLFAFALFLGFIYERQRCLFSNIFLHVTFNLVSVIRILTYEGG